MPEENKRRREISAPTKRQRCYSRPSRAQFAENQAYGHRLTLINLEHRHSKPVRVFHRFNRPIACHESQFSDLPSYECPVTPKNVEIPTYTHKVVAVSTLSRHSLAGYAAT